MVRMDPQIVGHAIEVPTKAKGARTSQTSHATKATKASKGSRSYAPLEGADLGQDGRVRNSQLGQVEVQAEGFAAFRAKLSLAINNSRFDSLMGVVVIANIIIMILETNENAPCAKSSDPDACKTDHMLGFNAMFQVLYTIECIARLIVDGKDFCKSHWNTLDSTIVVIGWADLIFTSVASSSAIPGPSVAILRIFRVGRLLRIVRILSFFPELYLMIRGFGGAMMAMFWGMVLIFGLLVVWALLTVELVNPINDDNLHGDNEWCINSTSSVYLCILFFFQTVFAGDSWGACAIPIIKEHWWTSIVFGGALITIQLGFTNLVLAVIVERATAAQTSDAETRHKEQLEAHKQKTAKLKEILSSIDEDGSGTLSSEELLSGYSSNKDLAHLLSDVGITEGDLSQMAALLADENGDGQICEFVDTLERCESDQSRQMLLLNLQVGNIKRSLDGMKLKMVAPVISLSTEGRGAVEQKKMIASVSETKDVSSHNSGTNASLAELQAESDRFNASLAGLQSSLDKGWSQLAKGLKIHAQEQTGFLTTHMKLLSSLAESAAGFPASVAVKTRTATDSSAPEKVGNMRTRRSGGPKKQAKPP